MQRNVQVKLEIDEGYYGVLSETFWQFQVACQYVADYAWRHRDDRGYLQTSKTWLHDQTYEALCGTTDLPTAQIQLARDYAHDALEQTIAKWKEGEKSSKPNFTSWFLAFDDRTITYTENGCTLATVDRRIPAKFVTPEDSDNPQSRYLSDNWSKGEATLHYRDGEYYLHITVSKVVDEEENQAGETENRTVLGVDLNTTGAFAVTSTAKFIGSGDYINHERDEYEKRRGDLQQKGSRRCHEVIGSIGGRFARWSEQQLHKWSNRLIDEAVKHGCTTIVFEDLEDIRERISNNKKFQQWAFNYFIEIVTYKAREYGVSVELVPAYYTSKKCSRCRCIDDGNRQSKHSFQCVECGYCLDADYNASKNIGLRFLHRMQKSPGGGATCQLALKSGMLKPSEDSSSTQDELEVEYMDKPLPQRANAV